MNNRLTEAYISILKEELLMATGCTEPIAIAYRTIGKDAARCHGPV